MPYKDNEKNKACKKRFNQSEEGKAYKREWYKQNEPRSFASVLRRKYSTTLEYYNELLEKTKLRLCYL